jgi:hypothetical protein
VDEFRCLSYRQLRGIVASAFTGAAAATAPGRHIVDDYLHTLELEFR